MKLFQKNETYVCLSVFIVMTVLTFWKFFFYGKIPVAGDLLLGGYHPWSDNRWNGFETIHPYLNSTISDSVTSFYPWKYRAINLLKNGTFPLMDDTIFMGNPLFETGTTGLLYPLSVIFFLLPFNTAWGILVSLTPLLSATFFFLWLKTKAIDIKVCLIMSICYAYSAFISLQFTFINSPHSVLWLPLILLSIDKLVNKFQAKYFILLVFSLFSSLNAGFFQGSLYITIFSFVYFIYQILLQKKKIQKLLIVFSGFVFSFFISAVQIIPFMEAVKGSSRYIHYGLDAAKSEIVSFFVKPEYLLTTLFPDFFGNPARQNYWGDPNYYEFNNFTGTITIIGFLIVFLNKNTVKKVYLYISLLIVSLVFATPNALSKLPYIYSLPVISSLVPSRILMLSQFCILVTAAFGVDSIIKKEIRTKKITIYFLLLLIFYLSIPVIIFFSPKIPLFSLFPEKNIFITVRNSYLPILTLIMLVSSLLIYSIKRKKIILLLPLLVTVFEMVRFSSYFLPFIPAGTLYPQTKQIEYLKSNLAGFRYSITHPELLPANVQSVYGLESVDGIGPIYPDRLNIFLASLNSSADGISRFPRMIYYSNNSSKINSLLNIKYIFSLNKLDDPDLALISNDGQTYLYENTSVLPRARILKSYLKVDDPILILDMLKQKTFNLKEQVIIPSSIDLSEFLKEDTQMIGYNEENGTINFNTKGGGGIAAISKQYLNGWKGYVDNVEAKVFPVNYNLIGLLIPGGEHHVKLRYVPASFKLGGIVTVISLFILIIYIIILRLKLNKYDK